MQREDLFDQLEQLLPGQFAEVVFRAGMPTAYLPCGTASQAERAIAVIYYMEQKDQLERLGRIVQQVMA